jgi:hypothetical protein
MWFGASLIEIHFRTFYVHHIELPRAKQLDLHENIKI